MSAIRTKLYGILGCDAKQIGRRIPITTLKVEAEGTPKTLAPICHTGRRRIAGLSSRRYTKELKHVHSDYICFALWLYNIHTKSRYTCYDKKMLDVPGAIFQKACRLIITAYFLHS